jgi:tetratricopeptide (TPR) repeat protein
VPALLLALIFAGAPAGTDVQRAFEQAERLAAAGDHAAAAAAYHELLALTQPGSKDRGRSLLGLAGIETDLGEYRLAARHGREAAEIFAALGDSHGRSRALNHVGRSAVYEGNYAAAARAFEAAVALSAASGDRVGHSQQLSNLGNAYYFQGRYSDAARAYDTALEGIETAASESWAPRQRRILLVNKATLLQRLGRYDEALPIYKDIVEHGELPPDEHAQVLVSLGVVYRRLGDPIKALETYEAARGLFSRHGHFDGELGVLTNRGIVQALDLGSLDAAEQSFAELIELATRTGNRREMMHAYIYRGETRRRAGQEASAHQDFTHGLALARELKTPEEEWKALYGLARTGADPAASRRLLEEAVGVIEAIREQIRVPALRSDFFNDKSEVYDALIAARLHNSSASELFELIERRHSRGWRDRLALAGAVDLQSVQRALPAGVLLLEYWSAPRGSALIAVTRDRAAFVRIDVKDENVRTLLRALDDRREDWREVAARLASDVLPPDEWFVSIQHVRVVADGTLAFVPFDLLPAGGALLVERAAVSYTPTSATLLQRAPAIRSWAPPWRLQLRAFADPVFASATLDDASVRRRLISSREEVEGIADEVSGRAVLHVGGDNRKAYLLEAGEPAPLLHLATHAAADSAAIERSRIVFSAASPEASSADYLFLREAYDLRLAGVELAVLSACDTERGQLTRGEGVQSFSRAFLAAGAQSTVTTLWRVADRPTADFMEVFYHYLNRGVARDEALRLAKQRFLESGSELAHPHYWAAFVLTGEGLQPVSRALSWTPIVVGSAILALGLVATAGVVRRRRSG